MFRLRLRAEGGGPVRVSASGLKALRGRSVALLRPAAGRSYDLRAEGSIRLEEADSTALRLAVGSGAYVQKQKEKVRPEEVRLTAYPNPIRRQGTLEYALPERADVRLAIYDVLGRRVAVLAKGRKPAGRYQVQLQARRLPSGVYFGRLRAGKKTRTQKITVVR